MLQKLKKIYTLWKAYKLFKEVKKMTEKKGVKTSEFWITLFFNLLTIFLLVSKSVKPEWAIATMGVLNAIYTYGRSIVKATKTEIDDKIYAEIEKIIEKEK